MLSGMETAAWLSLISHPKQSKIILTNITTTKGVKQDDGSIDIIITGQLPY